MSRKVELHPAADRDVDRLAEFLIPMSERAARARSKQIREKLRSLGEAPFKGRQGPTPDLRELVMRFGRSSYVARYRITDDAIIILRIWHGLEDRPKT
jgi:plasmid stabilization system protein ParE